MRQPRIVSPADLELMGTVDASNPFEAYIVTRMRGNVWHCECAIGKHGKCKHVSAARRGQIRV